MSVRLVNPEHLTEEEIQDSIEYWELYAWEAAQAKDRKSYDEAQGHIKALRQLADKLEAGEAFPSGSLEESRRRHDNFA